MKREIKELKRIARGNLQGNFAGLIRVLVFCNLIISLVETPFSTITSDSFLSSSNLIYLAAISLITIASVLLTVGQYCLHLSVARTKKIQLTDFIYPIKYDTNRLILAEVILFILRMIGMAPAIAAYLLILFYEGLGVYLLALGLCVLSLILTLVIEANFGMTYFALIDGEELTVFQAIKKAVSMMKTHKMRFIYMQFSFIGMYLLVLLTLGIGLLWVQPYIMQTTTVFYMDITGELDEVLEKQKESEPTPAPVAIDQYV